VTFTAFSKPSASATLLLSALALAACGESAQEKAKAQVCNARADISKQISTLSGLTVSANSLPQAKTSVEAIAGDLTKIKAAQANLDPSRKQQVEAATHTFETQLSSAVTSLVATLSLSNAATQVSSALTELVTGYKQTLAPISCS
jgi:tRNA/tmRNA/rRNA uracil-C5-methylase (TrmA/RlmC/RlmD family)